jgi:hypothetical protein
VSYDIRLQKTDGSTLRLSSRHHARGGTYELGGTRDAWLNVTYNYSPFFYQVFEGGIRSLYGTTAASSIPILEAAIDRLADEPANDDYWAATEGNARAALIGLLTLAVSAVEDGHGDSIWSGD